MIRSKIALIFFLAAGYFALAGGAPGKQPAPLKIGMVDSIFRDHPESKIQTILPELQNLLREHSGLEGDFLVTGDVFDLGKRLNDKAVQFGVFHGFEFAWARQKHPDLKPLLIAVNRQRELKAFLAVLNENKAAGLTELKGKIISIPRGCPEHCRLFLDRELAKLDTTSNEFFSKIVRHESVEDALDDILRGKVQATLVDGSSLENYSQVNPGRFARLKMLMEAGGFPPGLVAYKEGAVDDSTLTKFKQGMIKASATTTGKEQLVLAKLSAFEDVPADFQAKLNDILKRYPPPKLKTDGK